MRVLDRVLRTGGYGICAGGYRFFPPPETSSPGNEEGRIAPTAGLGRPYPTVQWGKRPWPLSGRLYRSIDNYQKILIRFQYVKDSRGTFRWLGRKLASILLGTGLVRPAYLPELCRRADNDHTNNNPRVVQPHNSGIKLRHPGEHVRRMLWVCRLEWTREA
jgi:hypothetical protein